MVYLFTFNIGKATPYEVKLFLLSIKLNKFSYSYNPTNSNLLVLAGTYDLSPLLFYCFCRRTGFWHTPRLIMHVQCGISVTGFAKHVADFFAIPVPLFYCFFIRNSVSVLQTANCIPVFFPCAYQIQQVNLVYQINLGAIFQGCVIISIITSLSESLQFLNFASLFELFIRIATKATICQPLVYF